MNSSRKTLFISNEIVEYHFAPVPPRTIDPGVQSPLVLRPRSGTGATHERPCEQGDVSRTMWAGRRKMHDAIVNVEAKFKKLKCS